MSKKFKDTKLGVFLGKTAPHILTIAGDLLPDAGVLGIVKNLIETDKTIALKIKPKHLAKLRDVSVRNSG